MNTTELRYYIFRTRGVAASRFYFCGETRRALPTDSIEYEGEVLTYEECTKRRYCVSCVKMCDAVNYANMEQHLLQSETTADEVNDRLSA